jgi:hypothetical protein
MSSSEKKGRQKKPTNAFIQSALSKPEILGRLDKAIREKVSVLFSFDPALLKDVEAEAQVLREQLLKDPENPLDRVMVDQVVCSWLETGASAYRKACLPECDKGRRLAPFLERQHHQAQSRLIRSIESLNRMRSLPIAGAEPETLRIIVERVEYPSGHSSVDTLRE